jgi:hypothetical protein
MITGIHSGSHFEQQYYLYGIDGINITKLIITKLLGNFAQQKHAIADLKPAAHPQSTTCIHQPYEPWITGRRHLHKHRLSLVTTEYYHGYLCFGPSWPVIG